MQVLLTLVQAVYGCATLPEMSDTGFDIAYVPLKDHVPLSYGMFYESGTHDTLLNKFISITKECSGLLVRS